MRLVEVGAVVLEFYGISRGKSKSVWTWRLIGWLAEEEVIGDGWVGQSAHHVCVRAKDTRKGLGSKH